MLPQSLDGGITTAISTSTIKLNLQKGRCQWLCQTAQSHQQQIIVATAGGQLCGEGELRSFDFHCYQPVLLPKDFVQVL
jgi:hypothetical protein